MNSLAYIKKAKLYHMNISLNEKFALICGSTQGIGFATAKALALAGANCILLARNESSLKQAVASLPIMEGQIHSYVVADFSDLVNLKHVLSELVNNITIEILINNTGGPKPGPIINAAEDEFTSAFNQHVIGNQLISAALIPGMKSKGYGRIINIVSTSVRTPLANLGVSNTIRAAVASWAKTLSNEIGQFNITVNNILPGLTETARLKSLIKNTAELQLTDELTVENQMLQTIPMRRFGKAEEIANVITFLASPAASYVNGTSIPVDGGKTPTV
jgi:3-oxoacyl-[acyl-carrier protein] reductase